MKRDLQGCAVILFTRVPFADNEKTRMAPVLTPQLRQDLSLAMLEDGCNQAKELGCPLFVHCEPAGYEGQMRPFVGEDSVLLPQPGEGLGMRMELAFQHAFAQGFRRCILVGSDVPELTAQTMRDAFRALTNHDSVLVPTFDGGYCLVGLTCDAPVSMAFPEISYGNENVLLKTLESLSKTGAACAVLPRCHDLDTPEDLRDFIGRANFANCPQTAAFVGRLDVRELLGMPL